VELVIFDTPLERYSKNAGSGGSVFGTFSLLFRDRDSECVFLCFLSTLGVFWCPLAPQMGPFGVPWGLKLEANKGTGAWSGSRVVPGCLKVSFWDHFWMPFGRIWGAFCALLGLVDGHIP